MVAAPGPARLPEADQEVVAREVVPAADSVVAFLAADLPGASAVLEAAVGVRRQIVTIWPPIGDAQITTSAIASLEMCC